jgi:hypothetical protein
VGVWAGMARWRYLDWIALDACEFEGRIADYGVADDDAVFWIAGFACSAGF